MATINWALMLLALTVHVVHISGSLVRKNVASLTEAEVISLQSVLRKLEDDTSSAGYQTLAAYHGEPSQCEYQGRPVACCVHGMATFPQWHRLYVAQFEQALVLKGLADLGVPYWDWTQPITELPALVQNQIFRDPQGGMGQLNSWFSGEISFKNSRTSRNVELRLFEAVAPGQNTKLYESVLDALEQDDYCKFEVQFEVAHNTIHYLVGGRNTYSLSTLEFSSYDPLFFLHHSNVDRLFAIWQELQKKRGKPADKANCNVELFNQDLKPFDRADNPIGLTRTLSKPKDLFSYLQLGYRYDDLSLNGQTVDQLYAFLEQRKSREAAFAVFALKGIGYSADVRVKVCEVQGENVGECQSAGDFFILGGANEMPWEFNYPYYFDVSKAVAALGQPLDGRFTVVAEVYSVNGTYLGNNVLSKPYASHRPRKGHTDPATSGVYQRKRSIVIRKDINVLTDEETYQLRQALSRLQNDTSIDGYQAVAEFHGLPSKCPTPDAAVRYACCIHGMATFPHWHRLFVVEVEDELLARGLEIGIPYWDWTQPNTKVPELARDPTYVDPVSGETRTNPFYSADIAFKGEKTVRDVQAALTETPKYGDHTSLYDGILLALEQTDFCDFEVQFEVVHNAPHFLVGGYNLFSLSTLEYSAFDPIFYLHHSNVDRLWAIWQALQIRRGLPYKAHCANSLTQEVLKPFGFPPPWNNDQKTFNNARPTNIYNYETVLDYAYDKLQFGGMTIDQLEHYLEERQAKERVFVGILLYGIQVSAWVDVTLSVAGGDPHKVGSFAVLGGQGEMPWRFDRLFKMEITDALEALGLEADDKFEVHLDITDVYKNKINESMFSHQNIIVVPGKDHAEEDYGKTVRIRNNVDSLTAEQAQNFRTALKKLKEDTSASGYNQIAAFHGEPKWCPSPDAAQKFACCVHGMAVFPHWHRLLTVQAENALVANGFQGGLPYWDWTLPITDLPAIVKDATYVDPVTGTEEQNPLYSGLADGNPTTRSVTPDLFEQPAFGKFTRLAEQVLLAFEQTNFCDFEVQFEVTHNYIHAAVGGNNQYSMASLRYTAYDPLFFLHHSMTDRIWVIWQTLQGYRGLPYVSANCALAELRKPLQPFAQTSVVNPDPVTRDQSLPFRIFDYKNSLGYFYDSFQFNGLSIPQLNKEIIKRQHDERAFVGFMLRGIKQSALVVFDIVKPSGEKTKAGSFYLLGDEYEMPWYYDRLYKYEITSQLQEFGLKIRDRYDISYVVYDLAGDVIGNDTFGKPVIIDSPAAAQIKQDQYFTEVQASSHVRRNVEDLTAGEVESIKNALQKTIDDGTFRTIAEYHGYPGLCPHNTVNLACCVHGSPVFPHWHRLYVEQLENALLSHGSAVSLPYWDWTQPIKRLPELVSKATYFDSRTRKQEINPFFRFKILELDAATSREPQTELFDSTYFLDNVLLALEQTSYCDFEIQFEVVHNAVHMWLGSRSKYSLSTLDFSSFDPAFFLHHAQVDRIWAIWQALQRYRGLPYNEADCGLNLMNVPLKPFNDPARNPFELTRKFSRPRDIFDYSNHFDYHYDNLKFNAWSIPQLDDVIKKQRSRDRLFAGFLLHNIGFSADVEIYVCVSAGDGSRNCNTRAGIFSVLGGDYEMPFSFDRLYKFDISEAIRKLGLRLDSSADFDLEVKVMSYNGSYVNAGLLPRPSVIFEPGEGAVQNEAGKTERRLVRKNVLNLTPAERRSLVLAMRTLQADSSADGFQSLAAFHALPPLCPSPEATQRFACCVHGMATFPQWHRLYTVQFEDALRRHGATVGVPYWDTVVPTKSIEFLYEKEWIDPETKTTFENPWSGAAIEFENQTVARDTSVDELGKLEGLETWSWKQYVYALEQDNYCDFEVQFEVAHNALHAWLGGGETYSMGHLHYASYDPAFILHHANVDRIFAIWQELQQDRGKDPNEVNCALELMQEPLKPFSFGAPYNLNPDTERYSKPEDAFDYKNHFLYEYDSLELNGLDVPRLQDYINQKKEKDRVFAGFMLKGIGQSAQVTFKVCPEKGDCIDGGYFYILGGSAEMPWRFDRLYKYEITEVLDKAGIDVRDAFTFEVLLEDVKGNALESNLLQAPSLILEPQSRTTTLHDVAPNRVRQDLSKLGDRDLQSLKAALRDLQNEQGKNSYQSIAGFHGEPALCPDASGKKYACCVHGMPTFPHWHRLYTVEVEDALIRNGASLALPYWDWTRPISALPELFTSETYYDAWEDEVVANPFARSYIAPVNGYTVRDPRPQLKKLSKDGKHSVLFDEVLLALEQTDYCDFEVQYEVVHNAAHFLIGGYQQYSLSTLDYSSYDPIFFIHHSFVDKIWATWQELQKRRGLSYDRADCAVNFMNEKLHPFDWPEYNPDARTRSHAQAATVFNYQDLDYHYDNLDIGGNNLDQLEELIKKQKSRPRVFAGFALRGLQTSADVEFSICKTDTDCLRAGGIFILGGPSEHPWQFDRLFKYDITDALNDFGLEPEDVFNSEAPFFLQYTITSVAGIALPASSITAPTLIFVPAVGASADQTSYSLAGIGVRKDINTLSVSEVQSLRSALRSIQEGTSGTLSYDEVAKAHGYPSQCTLDGQKVSCCQHGMASFPQWHRLFVRQMEFALTRAGAKVGIPYWDWTQAFKELPTLVADPDNNPFYQGKVPGTNEVTTRAPRNKLFNDPEQGEESFFYRQILLAFEQTDYCDFEVQFEVTHNAIHSWVGGQSPYGFSTLEYSAYDPIFFIHHSNVDRQFAIWQALQRYRGLDYNSANCNIQELRRPLEPFSWASNPVPLTRQYATAIDSFNYDQLGYQYDNLNFHGLTIPQLEELLQKRKKEDHIYANFLLKGFKTSADVDFDLCDAAGSCQFAGTFAVLGGPTEMPWSFDRLFKYEVTNVFQQLRLKPDSDYKFNIRLRAVNGTELDASLIPAPSVSFVPGSDPSKETAVVIEPDKPSDPATLIRYEVSALSLEQVSNLRNALYRLQNDGGPNGFEAIASYHGAPNLCPENATDKYACCRHGMPAFPAWHRLLTVQFERALRDKGALVGVPYWDWTRPIKALPSLFTDEYNNNPFKTYRISFENEYVQRDVQPALFEHSSENDAESLFYQTLTTLEETNYCDFEVQYEMLHNVIHALVGGTAKYGMATLGYSAFDPFFMVHHSSIDRVWKIWVELQKIRKKPFNNAPCAMRALVRPMEPFNYESVNADPFTKAYSRPIQAFDPYKFNYWYDTLRLNGHDVDELYQIIKTRQASTRAFAGFVLSGFRTSATVNVYLKAVGGSNRTRVGAFYVLGGPSELPWAYERVYKLDMTEAARRQGLSAAQPFNFELSVTSYDGTPLEVSFPDPVIIKRAANSNNDVLVLPLKKENKLPPKIVVRKGTLIMFHAVEAGVVGPLRELGSYTSAKRCVIPPGQASAYQLDVPYSLGPGDYYFTSNDPVECNKGSMVQISIDED